jgi:uncharacterized membrane protein YuzA (DUF378 family)
MKALHAIAFVLVVIGALNWGIQGAAGINVVDMLIGRWMVVERIVYILVGLSGILLALTHKKDCASCQSTPVAAQPTM